MIDLQNFHFIRPWWFLMLLPMAYVVWKLLTQLKRDAKWSAICDPHLLPHLLNSTNKKKRAFPLILLAVAWAIAVTALAGPTWQKQTIPVYQSKLARIIVVDSSESMLTTDVQPSRMVRARYKILDLLDHIKDGQVGMVAFAEQAYTVSPLTQDANTIAAMVPELSPYIMPVQGSNIAAGLQKAAQLLQQGGAQNGEIILVTDSKATSRDIKAAENIAKHGDSISVLAIGTTKGAPIKLPNGQFLQNQSGGIVISKLDVASLKKLAYVGGGRYASFTNNNTDLETVLQSSLQNRLVSHAEKMHEKTSRWHDEGGWLILLLLPIALIGFRRGWISEIFK